MLVSESRVFLRAHGEVSASNLLQKLLCRHLAVIDGCISALLSLNLQRHRHELTRLCGGRNDSFRVVVWGVHVCDISKHKFSALEGRLCLS